MIGDFVSEYLSGGSTHVLIPGRKDNLIGVQFGPISEQQAMRLDLSDLLALLDFDLAINDELTGSNVAEYFSRLAFILSGGARSTGTLSRGSRSA